MRSLSWFSGQISERIDLGIVAALLVFTPEEDKEGDELGLWFTISGGGPQAIVLLVITLRYDIPDRPVYTDDCVSSLDMCSLEPQGLTARGNEGEMR